MCITQAVFWPWRGSDNVALKQQTRKSGRNGPSNTWELPYTEKSMAASPHHNSQDFAVLGQLIEVLDQLGIQYAIGGSLASSAYGVVRFTQDADITVPQFLDNMTLFVKRVEGRFYVSQDAVVQANHLRTSFNLIHFETAFKIDIFIEKDTAFDRGLLSRRKNIELPGVDPNSLSFVSPEDVILLKLRWYSEGGQVSERQWRDVLGVVAVQEDALDGDYLIEQAQTLGLTPLLDRALEESRDH